jgi:hypothetical protein
MTVPEHGRSASMMGGLSARRMRRGRKKARFAPSGVSMNFGAERAIVVGGRHCGGDVGWDSRALANRSPFLYGI